MLENGGKYLRTAIELLSIKDASELFFTHVELNKEDTHEDNCPKRKP